MFQPCLYIVKGTRLFGECAYKWESSITEEVATKEQDFSEGQMKPYKDLQVQRTD